MDCCYREYDEEDLLPDRVFPLPHDSQLTQLFSVVLRRSRLEL